MMPADSKGFNSKLKILLRLAAPRWLHTNFNTLLPLTEGVHSLLPIHLDTM